MQGGQGQSGQGGSSHGGQAQGGQGQSGQGGSSQGSQGGWSSPSGSSTGSWTADLGEARSGANPQNPQSTQNPNQGAYPGAGPLGYGSGGHNTGGYNSGGYNTGGYSSGGFNTGGYSSGGYNTGSFSPGGQNANGQNPGGQNTGGFSAGGYNTGGFNAGSYNTGNNSAGNPAGNNPAGNSGDPLIPGLQPAWGPPPPMPPGRPNGKASGRASLIAAALGVGLLAGVLGGFGGSALYDDVADADGRAPTVSLPEPVKDDRNQTSGEVTTVASAVTPSVVSLEVVAGQSQGTGSGFVVDAENGYILTNNHVVSGDGGDAGAGGSSPDIQVVFQDGTQAKGTLVGADASYDLAVVKVKAKGLRELSFGDSDEVQVGDPVVAIGAPLGLTGTVTTGIVSALNRPVAAGEGDSPAFINAIQTDAAINPGNSGGPLVNAAGHVIAVNSAIARVPGTTDATGGSIGLGFAIPSNQAQRTAEQLIQTGKADHPIIGVTLDPTYAGEGVLVNQEARQGQEPVTPGGPADQAGIEPGDVITKFNGRPVTAPDELIVAIRAEKPGDTVTLTIRRGGGKEEEVKVKLSASSD
ncbi:S1C family serine protease [Kineosporia babensis]|uniref:Trypsin-like peptidase domain-containing protein n=1 Tax=Kineosporia babensis TaxID=499548 RepID=A0A9X1SX66_9ACTN|nr:trypsin-like peptidase domain-containing protein [Kineosporia babensis]